MRKIDLSNFRVATSETARDINRRIVLNLIRRHQPISRADLARESGLQRSTVSAITEQLIKEKWVTEGASGYLPRGRRPRFLHLNRERVGIIGINIRPIWTTIGLADLDARFMTQESLATPDDPEQAIDLLRAHLRRLIATHPDICYE
ncbi:MAG: ROK family transcriptional regulator, partial [Vicinamibacteraceae bacterium]